MPAFRSLVIPAFSVAASRLKRPYKIIGGLYTEVLPPQKLDFKILRRGKMPEFVGEAAEVDGVLFATTDFGDSFVFDVSVRNSDYPVCWYKHEESLLEPYAPNFAECIKRFTEHN